jgi:hypothetical protein
MCPCRIARLYAELEGVPLSTVSSRVFNDGKKIRALEEGSDINVSRLERALRWFSDKWPEDADWPADVPRPFLTEPVEARA